MAPQLRKAERRQAKMRVGITAPSGGGKTFSALLIARGLASAWDKVALIDTENGSGELYAHLGPYNVLTLDAPFTPERYIEAIKACEKAGMDAIVIDSATHEWDGPGGCLEIYNKLGGKYQDWAKITPRHQGFLDAIIQSDCHVITTTRRKQDYEMEKSSDGKVRVVKVGMKEVQRDGFEYELTLGFELDIRHLATGSKDRTGLFMDKPEFVITEETGRTIKAWCESGAPAAPKATLEPTNGTAVAGAAPAESPITITAIAEKPYTEKGEKRTGYVLTFSDGREARTTDEALANRAKSYIETKLPLVVACEKHGDKLVVLEFAPADEALGF